MLYDFVTITHGKWILVGEHAVLRGHPALVFPVKNKTLCLNYRTSNHSLSVTCSGLHATELKNLFKQVLEYGKNLLNQSDLQLFGQINLENNIPIGEGLGASAALCVAVARWFVSQTLINPNDTSNFAKQLEHLFHGQSSGLDIAGASSTSGILFENGKELPCEQTWQPNWSLSRCGETGLTSNCIHQVMQLWKRDPIQAERIDQQMKQCVLNAHQALIDSSEHALKQLADAINQACDCFRQWGLISPSLEHHMQERLKAGALAVKPTGSGNGGHVISLFPNT